VYREKKKKTFEEAVNRKAFMICGFQVPTKLVSTMGKT
jgi:hypothetical protein